MWKVQGREVARWERWENGEVARWKVPGFIQEWIKMLIINGTKEQDSLKIIWHGQRNGRTLHRSNTSY